MSKSQRLKTKIKLSFVFVTICDQYTGTDEILAKVILMIGPLKTLREETALICS